MKSILKYLYRGWIRNGINRLLVAGVLLPPVILYYLLQLAPFWLILIALPLFPAWFYYSVPWAWKRYDQYGEPSGHPLTPEQVWELRFRKFADSTDALPQGLTLTSFCLDYDETVLKQAMHLLHCTPPGSRHLRVALQELL